MRKSWLQHALGPFVDPKAVALGHTLSLPLRKIVRNILGSATLLLPAGQVSLDPKP